MRVKQLMQHRLQSDNRGGGSKSSNSNSYANQADSIGPGGVCNHFTWPTKTRYLDRKRAFHPSYVIVLAGKT